jgi:hypothetical protein
VHPDDPAVVVDPVPPFDVVEVPGFVFVDPPPFVPEPVDPLVFGCVEVPLLLAVWDPLSSGNEGDWALEQP